MNRLFNAVARGRWLVSTQNPAHLNDWSEPQPDLTLLKPAPDDYTTHHPRPDDVLLLIEVADSSLTYDRRKKLPAYARAGIGEVWIVNLPERTTEVYREPQLHAYGSKTVLRAGDTASPASFPDVRADVSGLLNTGL